MPRQRRLISPAVTVGVSFLALFVAVVLTGTMQATRDIVAGSPNPRYDRIAEIQDQEDPPPAPPVSPASPQAQAPQAPAPAGQPEPMPDLPPNKAKPAKPPDQQRPGTVRLAHGGTAFLVRREVGPDGVLPIPSAINQATWWGADPSGPKGAVVLAGHINWKGAVGPFAELWHAEVGDPATVVDKSGRTLNYRVTGIVTLHKDELPSRAGELFAQDGPHRLVLVTCGGQWVGGQIGYASNQIVIATPA
jgi:hypothetical protein